MANTIISLSKASVGDAIAIKSDADGNSSADFIAVIGNTASSTPPTGYTWYGVVYGKEKGGLMVAYHTQVSKKFADNADETLSSSVSINFDDGKHQSFIDNTVSWNGNTMLNGSKHTYVTMNLSRVIALIDVESNTSTLLHPLSPYLSESEKCPMNRKNFLDNVSGARSMYGTYENYVAQTLPYLKGAKGGVFSKRCGRQNTLELQNTALGASDGIEYHFPAPMHCYNLVVASEDASHWWLPDMFEMNTMMSDESFDKCYATVSRIDGSWGTKAANRWSCCRCGATGAWDYSSLGFSTANYFYHQLLVCPVTLLSLNS